MNRGMRVLIVASILAVLVALLVVGLWQLEARGVPRSLAAGVAFIVIGALLTTLHLTVSDDYIRRNEWQPGKDHLRQGLRRGWYVMVIGAAFIGLHYLDRWMLAGPP